MLGFVPRRDHFFGLVCDAHHLISLCSARTVLLFFSLSFFPLCAMPRIPGERGRRARPLLCHLCFGTIFFLFPTRPWSPSPLVLHSPLVSLLPTWHRSMADVSLLLSLWILLYSFGSDSPTFLSDPPLSQCRRGRWTVGSEDLLPKGGGWMRMHLPPHPRAPSLSLSLPSVRPFERQVPPPHPSLDRIAWTRHGTGAETEGQLSTSAAGWRGRPPRYMPARNRWRRGKERKKKGFRYRRRRGRVGDPEPHSYHVPTRMVVESPNDLLHGSRSIDPSDRVFARRGSPSFPSVFFRRSGSVPLRHAVANPAGTKPPSFSHSSTSDTREHDEARAHADVPPAKPWRNDRTRSRTACVPRKREEPEERSAGRKDEEGRSPDHLVRNTPGKERGRISRHVNTAVHGPTLIREPIEEMYVEVARLVTAKRARKTGARVRRRTTYSFL